MHLVSFHITNIKIVPYSAQVTQGDADFASGKAICLITVIMCKYISRWVSYGMHA